MHPDHALGRARGFGDARDRNRRGIGREHSRGREHRFDLAEYLLLDAELLKDRFDRQLRTAEASVGVAAGQERDEPSVFEFCDAAPLQPVIEDGAAREHSLRDAGEVGVLHPHIDLRLGHGGPGDARTHEAGADDAESLHTDVRRRVRHAGILLELIRREENLYELAGDVRDR